MLSKLKNRKEEGFTIIEVLIVLAIAGLIMLVVFLAVPALQRNQRNQERRAEASRIATSTVDYITNASGANPTTPAQATAIIDDAGVRALAITANNSNTAAVDCTDGSGVASNMPTTRTVNICQGPATGVTFTPTNSINSIVIATNAQCNGAGGVVRGASRQVAVVYTLESGGSTNRTLACITS